MENERWAQRDVLSALGSQRIAKNAAWSSVGGRTSEAMAARAARDGAVVIAYAEAIATVEKAGIPGHCAYVRAGDAYDYQDVAGVPQSSPTPLFPDEDSPAWKETNEAVEEWEPTPEVATRRWVWCETILDEVRLTKAGFTLAYGTFDAAGWESIGSGGFRIEVDPTTVPADEDPFKNYELLPVQANE